MNRTEIMSQLQETFRELFEDDEIEISDATTAADIEAWDSLAHIELISMVENQFRIHFSLGEINSFANVGEMCDCILKHLA